MIQKLTLWMVLAVAAIAAPHVAIATCADECPDIDIPCPPDCWPAGSNWSSWCYEQYGFCCECFMMNIWCDCPEGGVWNGWRQYSTWKPGKCRVIDDYRSGCIWAIPPPE